MHHAWLSTFSLVPFAVFLADAHPAQHTATFDQNSFHYVIHTFDQDSFHFETPITRETKFQIQQTDYFSMCTTRGEAHLV